jgi:hypothetical protein
MGQALVVDGGDGREVSGMHLSQLEEAGGVRGCRHADGYYDML